jgi:hypothetical protein
MSTHIRSLPVQTCETCGLPFVGSAYSTHQNAYPLDHPLSRCADPMEMQALGYKRRKSDGAYTADITTDTHPSSARMLATFRQEHEQYELTGDVPVHVRMIPLGWLDDSLAKPLVRRAKVAKRVRNYRQRKASLWGRIDRPPVGRNDPCNAVRARTGIALHAPA